MTRRKPPNISRGVGLFLLEVGALAVLFYLIYWRAQAGPTSQKAPEPPPYQPPSLAIQPPAR